MSSPVGYDMREFILLLLSVAIAATSLAEIKDPVATEVWQPVPRKITGAANGAAPSDAIVLFDGSSLSEWKSQIDGSVAKWKVENGYLVVVAGTGDILTTRRFGDIQLHIEWSSPTVIVGAGQGRGNIV